MAKKRLFLIPQIFTVCLFFLTACDKFAGASNKQEQTLEETLSVLFSANFAKHFPRSKEQFDNCVDFQDPMCLEPFNGVIEAKKRITSLPRQETLEKTLAIISRSCLSENEVEANYLCYGALISLYFYDSKKEDAFIFEKIRSMSKELQSIVFNYNFSWFQNRKSPDVWMAYLDTADIDWKYPASKEVAIEQFDVTIEKRPLPYWLQ